MPDLALQPRPPAAETESRTVSKSNSINYINDNDDNYNDTDNSDGGDDNGIVMLITVMVMVMGIIGLIGYGIIGLVNTVFKMTSWEWFVYIITWVIVLHTDNNILSNENANNNHNS